jgi:hypothetical protein
LDLEGLVLFDDDEERKEKMMVIERNHLYLSAVRCCDDATMMDGWTVEYFKNMELNSCIGS